MPLRGRHRSTSTTLLVLLATAFLYAPPNLAQEPSATPTVVGPDPCGECHQHEIKAWRQSQHQQGFFTMHRTAEAKAMAKALGIKRIKRAPLCLSCHYSEAPQSVIAKAATGVSCESCHGPASGWLDPHASYGGADATRDTETEAHRRERQEQSLAHGMRPPFALYRLAERCYDCHVIAEPELVNEAGHPAASALELVAWTQGEVRHNYFFSSDQSNREATPERRRALYVLGHGLALEHGLRALHRDGAGGGYADAMTELVDRARAALAAVQARTPLPEVAAMLEADSAAEVGAAARAFAEAHDGTALSAVDELLPAADAYVGQAAR